MLDQAATRIGAHAHGLGGVTGGEASRGVSSREHPGGGSTLEAGEAVIDDWLNRQWIHDDDDDLRPAADGHAARVGLRSASSAIRDGVFIGFWGPNRVEAIQMTVILAPLHQFRPAQ